MLLCACFRGITKQNLTVQQDLEIRNAAQTEKHLNWFDLCLIVCPPYYGAQTTRLYQCVSCAAAYVFLQPYFAELQMQLKKDNECPRHIRLCSEENYRPVSNLSFLSKLLETTAQTRLEVFLDCSDLMPTDSR